MAPLGCGGMGEVWRADDLELGQSVALKFLPPRAIGGAELDRFRREVRVARGIQTVPAAEPAGASRRTSVWLSGLLALAVAVVWLYFRG